MRPVSEAPARALQQLRFVSRPELFSKPWLTFLGRWAMFEN
ncbi:hypothetical protein SC1_02984 [Sphingopyxis sp. C-1]|nr:hypothetical protein SC1_02984 [Sphingopyxis sp. C-1]